MTRTGKPFELRLHSKCGAKGRMERANCLFSSFRSIPECFANVACNLTCKTQVSTQETDHWFIQSDFKRLFELCQLINSEEEDARGKSRIRVPARYRIHNRRSYVQPGFMSRRIMIPMIVHGRRGAGSMSKLGDSNGETERDKVGKKVTEECY